MACGIPGGSPNMTYLVLCGGGLTAAVVYAYKTVSGDSDMFDKRPSNTGTNIKVSEPAEETQAAESTAEPVVEAGSEEAPPVEDAPAAVVAVAASTEPEVKEEDAAPVAVEAVAVEAEESATAAVEEEPSPLPEVETAPTGPDAELNAQLAA